MLLAPIVNEKFRYEHLVSNPNSTFGFSRLPPEMEAYIHNHIKPAYDEGCIFMYQIL